MDYAQLATPALVVDVAKVEQNIMRWQHHATLHGVAIRPHIKTHKTIEIARMQHAAGATGITAAKLSEAEVFIAAGFADVFVAYPIIGHDKALHAATLAQQCKLIVGVDSHIGIAQLQSAAAQMGSTIHVRVELDSGLHRCGVAADQMAELCRAVMRAPHLELDGIFTYRGAWFAGANGRTPTALGIEEATLMVDLAQQLRRAGIPIHAVSVGSTPTGMACATVAGITEIRPGTYVFGDDMQLLNGACSPADVALQIVCTIISRPDATTATIDAGSKTFAGDINYEKMGLTGYATGVDVPVSLIRMSEEHGVLHVPDTVDLPIGTRIALRPIHVCTTVNLSDTVYFCDRTGHLTAVAVVARGKRT